MTRFTTGLMAAIALVVCINSAFAIEVFHNGTSVFREDWEGGTHQNFPPGWAQGGAAASETWVWDTTVSTIHGAPAIEGDKYLYMGNNCCANGNLLRNIGQLVGGTVRAEWMAWMVSNHTDAIGGTIALRTDGPGENRAGVSWNRVTSTHADANGTDTGIAIIPEQWQEWAVDYDLNANTFTVSIDGQTSPVINGGTAGPANIGEVLLAATFRDFIIDAVIIPEPASMALLGLGGLMLLRRRSA
ncbi:MAG: hypothetical protein CMJ18_00060 [Phycisphaeraceae bacterium]|nr:hypothetical protein [Phycisphaeraceae bacterium]